MWRWYWPLHSSYLSMDIECCETRHLRSWSAHYNDLHRTSGSSSRWDFIHVPYSFHCLHEQDTGQAYVRNMTLYWETWSLSSGTKDPLPLYGYVWRSRVLWFICRGCPVLEELYIHDKNTHRGGPHDLCHPTIKRITIHRSETHNFNTPNLLYLDYSDILVSSGYSVSGRWHNNNTAESKSRDKITQANTTFY